jgi:hypothetical protein
MAKHDAVIQNYAPDMDLVAVYIGVWKVSVSRDENEKVSITVEDTFEVSETVVVLGEEGETQRV